MNLQKLKCSLTGHKWKYNFSTMPNKTICTKCKTKAMFDLHFLEWNTVKTFEGETRTDEELIEQWVNLKY
jgi:hypothetical protein